MYLGRQSTSFSLSVLIYSSNGDKIILLIKLAISNVILKLYFNLKFVSQGI